VAVFPGTRPTTCLGHCQIHQTGVGTDTRLGVPVGDPGLVVAGADPLLAVAGCY
jgi:hypothetical protein